MTISQDHTLAEVADALGMSTRWVRRQIAEGAEHQRYGNRIAFTDEQVAALRARFTRNAEPAPTRVTAGRRGAL